MILLFILAVINPMAVAVAKILIDYKIWLKKQNLVNLKSMINHTKEWFIMAACCLPGIYALGKLSNNFWIGSIAGAFMYAFFLWIIVDGGFNLIRNFPWSYTGSGESTAANSDKFLRKLKPWMQVVLKFGLLILSCVVYYIFY